MSKDYSDFIEKLENQHSWPSEYMFKFIVPSDVENEIKQIFSGQSITSRESSKGNYTSITVKMMINSTDEVIRIYEEAHKVEGVIAL